MTLAVSVVAVAEFLTRKLCGGEGKYRKSEKENEGFRMISRIWHGWTTMENSAKYESLLRAEVLPGIHRVRGYNGAYLLRREAADNEIEFLTITQFTDMAAVKAFAGEDYERAVIAPGAGKFLTHHDERSAHYETLLTPADVRALAARASGRHRVI
jgi:heme-degrading monooxygenase HmoA